MDFKKTGALILASCFILTACEDKKDAYTELAKAQPSTEPAKVTPPAPPAPPVIYGPLSYADTSLRRIIIKHDIKKIIDEANALGLNEKKEFEKKEAFAARKAEFVSAVNSVEGKPSLLFFVPSRQIVKYDADKERFNLELDFYTTFDDKISYNSSKSFPLSVSIATESVRGEKMYGLPVYESIDYKVGFKTNLSVTDHISMAVPVPMDQAKSLKDSLAVAVVGKVVDPVVMRSGNFDINHDSVDQYTDKTLLLSGVQFWIYDKDKLEVKAKFDSNLKKITSGKVKK
ncbi:hypothetical protein [Pseudomonas juntendi]|uniref:hypothetical protein n=1 Tax=Pseudomonas juntendi TaxID=2666183 RepID=UPI001B82413A|nr:hypothetical protein [Pseudomonas juntendi]MBR7522904.1 hypothetical protein [Pseudomonas juntendi]